VGRGREKRGGGGGGGGGGKMGGGGKEPKAPEASELVENSVAERWWTGTEKEPYLVSEISLERDLRGGNSTVTLGGTWGTVRRRETSFPRGALENLGTCGGEVKGKERKQT